jgi:pimeloyl-ACP methyl ester carboxylesterase
MIDCVGVGMLEEKVVFQSDGLRLCGVLSFPREQSPNKRYPAMMVLHGFGSNKDSTRCVDPCRFLSALGYATLRFDMRGCGESEGEPRRVICLEQVSDTRSAISFLAAHANIDPDRIGCMGSSFGGAVTIYTAGIDPRIAAVISVGGWGDGVAKFRRQHSSPGAWERFIGMLEEGKRHRDATGQSLMVPRFDIVPIPEELRHKVAKGSHLMFPAETAQSMYDFRAIDVVAKIAPRPLLLLHPSVDSVTPTEQSIELFRHAGQPTELHLFAGMDHFLLGDKEPAAENLLRDWLARFFPA